MHSPAASRARRAPLLQAATALSLLAALLPADLLGRRADALAETARLAGDAAARVEGRPEYRNQEIVADV